MPEDPWAQAFLELKEAVNMAFDIMTIDEVRDCVDEAISENVSDSEPD